MTVFSVELAWRTWRYDKIGEVARGGLYGQDPRLDPGEHELGVVGGPDQVAGVGLGADAGGDGRGHDGDAGAAHDDGHEHLHQGQR